MVVKTKKPGGIGKRPRATVKCGKTTYRNIAHGCGAGTTGPSAIDAAIAEAKIVAQAAGEAWIAAQKCPLRCPGKSSSIYSPPKGQYARKQPHKVLSQQKLRVPATGKDGHGQVFRVCVAILWEAIVECKAGFERFE